MYRIDNSTAAVAMPAFGAVGPNVDAFFTDGDPATATPATIVPADWLNSFQEELCQFVESAGVTLVKGSFDQLRLAVDYLAQKNEAIYAESASAPNAYTLTLDPAPLAYVAGMAMLVKFANANTNTSVTINVNTLGAKSIKRYDGSALAVGDIESGSICHLVYDGTQFLMMNSVLDLFNNYGTTASAPNAYVATLSDAITSYTDGLFLLIKFTNGNTGAATINVNSLGVKDIVRKDSSALIGGEISDGMVAMLVYDGTNFQVLNMHEETANAVPQFTTYTSGSGTYTTPAGAIQLRVKLVGGGGGGGNGHPNIAGQGTGATGGTTSFGAFSALGGAGGNQATARGAGGIASGGNIANINGGDGQGGWSVFAGSLGGSGGNSTLGGAGTSIQGNAGGHAATNTGSGGSGGGGSSPIPNSGSGGGAGATVEFYINSPAASYSYSVGAGGAGYPAGGGTAGGNGASGIIIIEAIF